MSQSIACITYANGRERSKYDVGCDMQGREQGGGDGIQYRWKYEWNGSMAQLFMYGLIPMDRSGFPSVYVYVYEYDMI